MEKDKQQEKEVYRREENRGDVTKRIFLRLCHIKKQRAKDSLVVVQCGTLDSSSFLGDLDTRKSLCVFIALLKTQG
jgi:hypothetical protein